MQQLLANASANWRRMVVLPLAALAALVVLVINESAFHRSEDSLATASAHALARTQIQNVLRLLLDAETGQRGYLLTGRVEYLEPYEQAVGEAQQTLQALDAFYTPSDRARPTMDQLKSSALEKLSELSSVLTLYREGREQAWRELMLTDIGREKMDAVRLAADRLFEMENARVADMREALYTNFNLGRIGVNTMAALSLLALFLYQRQSAALALSRRLHSEALQRERDQLEFEVGRRTAELTALTHHLQTAREDERSRLARELHDELGALLTAAKLDAARLKRLLMPMSGDAAERLKHLNATIDQVISLKRDIIESLCPSSLSNLGLVSALEIQAREFGERADLKMHVDLNAVSLSDSAQTTVYRLVQESLTNIAKYAGATQVWIALAEDAGGARVTVRDDGRGFDPTMAAPSSHGLRGMRYRVAAEGGRMRVDSGPGRGALIEVWLPAAPADAPAPASV